MYNIYNCISILLTLFNCENFLYVSRYGAGGFGSRDYRQIARERGGSNANRTVPPANFTSPNFTAAYSGNHFMNTYRNNYSGNYAAPSTDWWGN